MLSSAERRQAARRAAPEAWSRSGAVSPGLAARPREPEAQVHKRTPMAHVEAARQSKRRRIESLSFALGCGTFAVRGEGASVGFLVEGDHATS